MKKFLALLTGALVLFAPAFFMSCSNDDDDDGDDGTVGQIVGYVLDNKGEPVEGATIALGTQLTQSNVNGVFTLNKVAANKAPVNPSDTYTLLVTKDGYLPTTIPNVIVLSKFNYNYKEKLDALMKIYIGMNQGETGLSTQEALAAAFEALPASYTTDTSTLSTFASAELIPLDASFEGTVKLNTMPKGATILGEEKLREGVKVRARYAGTSTTADYSDETTTDEKGAFKFENLPSGVPITLEIDAFLYNYNGNDCYYSSESADYIGNQTGTSNGETITLVSGGSNVQSYTIMLYAQVDKIWVVNTNVNTSTPLSPTASITFTFNTPMKNVSLLSSDIADISEGKYTVEIDTPNVVTVTPNDGRWSPLGSKASLILNGEATNGAKAIINNEFDVYFDTGVWVSIDPSTADEGLPLNMPITLTFSKAMNQETVSITAGENTFTKNWSSNSTSVTLTPKGNSWNCNSSDGSILFTVTGEAIDGANDISYWKANADSNGVKAYFDTYIDVTVTTNTTGTDTITLSFSKALKAFTTDNINIQAIQATDSTVTAYTVTFDRDREVRITASTNDYKFAKAGKYSITLTGIEAKDGSTQLRKAGETIPTTVFYTDLAFAGTALKATDVKVVDTKSGSLSRALVSTSQYLKITFNRTILQSRILLSSSSTDNSADNYIDGTNVYIPLSSVPGVDAVLGVSGLGSVVDVDGNTLSWEAQNALNTLLEEKNFYVQPELTLEKVSYAWLEDGTIQNGGATTVTVSSVALDNGPVYFTFSDTIEAGAEVRYQIMYDDPASSLIYRYGSMTVSDNTRTVELPEADMRLKSHLLEARVSDNGELINNYYIALEITKNGNTLFSTASKFFGNASTMEKKLRNASVITGSTIRVPVKTTTVSVYESPSTITVYFNHDVTGYTARLYNYDGYGNSYPSYEQGNYFEESFDYKVEGSVMTITVYPNRYHASGKILVGIIDRYGDWVDFAGEERLVCDWNELVTLEVEDVVTSADFHTITVTFNYDVTGCKPRLYNYDGYGNSYPSYEQGNYFEESFDYTVDGNRMTITVYPNWHSTHALGKVLVGIIDRYGEWVYFSDEARLVRDWNELVTLAVENVVTSVYAHTITVTFNYDVTGYTAQLYNYNYYPSYKPIGDEISEYFYSDVNRNVMTITISLTEAKSGNVLVGICDTYNNNNWVSNLVNADSLVRNWSDLWPTE